MLTDVRVAFVAALALAALIVLPSGARAQTSGPDALYRLRDDPSRARAAIEIWKVRLAAAPDDIEAGWRLARAMHFIGAHGPGSKDERKQWLEEGLAAARRVAEIAPDRPEGHFWMAANMGTLSEDHGTREGIRYRRPSRDALERVIALAPGYLGGAADRALGRWYFKVPAVAGGNKDRAEEHLRRALTYDDASTSTHVFLAELLIDRNRRDEARKHLEAAVAAPVDPEFAPEERVFKQQAATLLERLR